MIEADMSFADAELKAETAASKKSVAAFHTDVTL